VFVEVMEDDPLDATVGADRTQCPTAIRSVTLSVPDLDDTTEFFGGALGLPRAAAPLHDPQHEALWGLAGAKNRSRVYLAGDVLVEVVQYAEPVGKPWPAGYRICDQGILNVAFGARNKRDFTEVYRRATAEGAKANSKPVHLPGVGVVYVNDAHGFSVELLWMAPGAQDRRWGFAPRPIGARPAPDTRRIEHRVRIAAPIERVWDVLTDHDGMAAWGGFDRITLTRDGAPERNGYGAQRTLKGSTGTMVEEVVGWNPPHALRYRVVEGSPVVCHQGEIRLARAGEGTYVQWTIRFRPRIPGTGPLLRSMLDRMAREVVTKKLKAFVERNDRARPTRIASAK